MSPGPHTASQPQNINPVAVTEPMKEDLATEAGKQEILPLEQGSHPNPNVTPVEELPPTTDSHGTRIEVDKPSEDSHPALTAMEAKPKEDQPVHPESFEQDPGSTVEEIGVAAESEPIEVENSTSEVITNATPDVVTNSTSEVITTGKTERYSVFVFILIVNISVF